MDHLPFIDGDITPQEKAAAEHLVCVELASHPAPKPSQALQAPHFKSLVMQDIQHYEETNADNGSMPDSILGEVIDISRYHQFSPLSPDYKAMYTALSYAVLRERSSRLQLQNSADLASRGMSVNATLANVAEIQKAEISRKRAALEEVQSRRILKQQKFAPVESHLNERWKNGVRSLVDYSMQE